MKKPDKCTHCGHKKLNQKMGGLVCAKCRKLNYYDALHFTTDELTASFGEKSVTLNKGLLDQQLAWKNLEKILLAHQFKLMLYEMIEDSSSTREMYELGKDLTLVEFHLQKLWGFEKDSRYHKWWYYPKCLCPKLDNDDNYPSGMYYVAGNCPLHWL